MIRLLVILVTAFLTFDNIKNDPLIDTMFIAVCLWAVFENRHHINIYSLISIIIVMRGVEWGVMATLGGNNPMVFYPATLFIDVTAVMLIIFRVPLVCMLQRDGTSSDALQRNYVTSTDFWVAGIYIVYLFVTCISFVEHWIRHIDDIPYAMPVIDDLFQYEWVQAHYAPFHIYDAESFVAYFYEKARHVYYSAPTFKAYLNTLELIIILSTSYEFMRRSNKFYA